MEEKLMKILCDSLHYTFDEEACVSTLDLKKTVANLIANGVTVPVQCFECDAECCAYNPDGVCKFALVYGREPVLHDDGCDDFCYKEG